MKGEREIFLEEADDYQALRRLLMITRRIHGIAKRLAPNDPELATIEDELDEVSQVLETLETLAQDEDDA